MELKGVGKEDLEGQDDKEVKSKLVNKVITSTEDTVTIGETTFQLAALVDNPEKYGKLIVDIITNDDWVEKRMQQLQPHFDPFVQVQDMEEWDKQNFDRYPQVFVPQETRCSHCGQRICDLSDNRKGHCGLSLEQAVGLHTLRKTCTGAQKFVHQARLLYDYVEEHLDLGRKIDLGFQVFYCCPFVMLLTGLSPETLADLKPVLEYLEREITEISSAATWQTNLGPQDLEARALHAGTLSFLASEVCELINIVAMDHSSGGCHDIVALQKFPLPNTPVGAGTIDKSRFVILFVGTGDIIAWETVRRVKERGLSEEVELCGVGDAGLKLTRIYDEAKVLGIGAHLLKFLRLGIPDLIIYDGECGNLDIMAEAERLGVPLIIPSKKAFAFARNLTRKSPEEIVEAIVQEPASAVTIVDYSKAAETALSLKDHLTKRNPSLQFVPGELQELARPYAQDTALDARCPAELDLTMAFQAACQGDFKPLQRLGKTCTYCALCEERTVGTASPLDLILKASEEDIRGERTNMRGGRGPTTHVEYRDAAFAVVAGAPGFLTLAGCADSPNAIEEITWMAEEGAALGCAVSLLGCTAIAAGQGQDEKGKTIYERRYATIQIRGVVNIGECSAACHCLGGDTKLTVVAGRVTYRANYLEIIDRLLNKWPTVVILWGATSERFAALAAGWVRAGIPVIVGPSSQELVDQFRLGDHLDAEKWWLYDSVQGTKLYVEPAKRHLLLPVSSKEEAINMAVKLMINPCDLWIMREAKIMHYVDSFRLLDRQLPDDWQYYARHPLELTTRLRFKLLRDLERKGWDVIVKKGAFLSVKRPDGTVVSLEEFSQKHRIPNGISGVRTHKLIHKD